MIDTPSLHIDSDNACIRLLGSWTLAHYSRLARELEGRFTAADPPVEKLDASALTGLDTAGATLLVRQLGAERVGRLAVAATGLSSERRALLEAIADAMEGHSDEDSRPASHWTDFLARTGVRVERAWQQTRQFLGFTGLTLSTLGTMLFRPWRWRVTALVAQIHQTGLNALPIVALLSFLIGAVVAFLGATVLEQFGATIYTVDLVAYAFLRELGTLLAAILLAGRTASAFAAQLGSMKINEEIDALHVQGLSPVELLVLPRLLALLIMLPVLSFVSIIAGMVGGAAVAVLSLDVTLTRYLAIVQDVPVRHLLLGLSKAPVFAVPIALIGCLEGFKVSGSAQSLGEHTTSAVVQSLVAVIVLNGIAAMFFMEMGW